MKYLLYNAKDCLTLPNVAKQNYTTHHMNTQQYHTTIQSNGFSQIETGGGCAAFSKTDDKGVELLITAQDDPSVPAVDDVAILSRDGEILGEFTADELVAFLAAK